MNETEYFDLHVNEMKIRGRSKKELYNLLTIQGYYYLPHAASATLILFLKL